MVSGEKSDTGAADVAKRVTRSDAKRNQCALLQAAMDVFKESGVNAPVRAIADRAGVGVGTFYRHYPQRADLIVAVLKSQIDDFADAAAAIVDDFPPDEALDRWVHGYVDFILGKRGLSNALQAENTTHASPLATLLAAALERNLIHAGYGADELLRAIATLCKAAPDDATDESRKMVALLVNGLRCRA
jgi:AcrR family transcriptional regulator